jgi:polyisoprenoid-binding protein YceI
MMTVVRRAIAVVGTLVVLLVGGPWVYINLIRGDAPEALTLPATTVAATTVAPATTVEASTTSAAPVDPSGRWIAGEGSVAGYRVDEVLFGQNVTAVGRTAGVEGSITIDGGAVRAAEFTVDMGSVKSDNAKRDSQFANRIMDVLNHPTATFVLTEPVALTPEALAGGELTAAAVGEMTLRGTTRPVTLDLRARLTGGTVEVVTSLEIVFAEWGIPEPSLPGIRVEDRGVLEVLLLLRRA